jgi:hypothetical protein
MEHVIVPRYLDEIRLNSLWPSLYCISSQYISVGTKNSSGISNVRSFDRTILYLGCKLVIRRTSNHTLSLSSVGSALTAFAVKLSKFFLTVSTITVPSVLSCPNSSGRPKRVLSVEVIQFSGGEAY